MAYATNADVARRVPTRTVSASSKPSTTDIDAWIAETEAEVEAKLINRGLTAPITDTRGILLLRSRVVDKVTALYIEAVTDGTNVEARSHAKELRQTYQDFLDWISISTAEAATMLGQGPGSSGGPEAIRSYVTENQDGLSIDGNDFDATFTRGMKF